MQFRSISIESSRGTVAGVDDLALARTWLEAASQVVVLTGADADGSSSPAGTAGREAIA